MIVAQFLGSNNPVKISLHKLLHEIDFLEVIEVGRPEDIENGDYILVMKVPKEFNFPKGSKAEH
jgi:hypothetical protein